MVQFIPKLIASSHQRHIICVLEIRKTYQPRLAVGASAVVGGRKTIDPETFQSPGGSTEKSRAAYAACAENDEVVEVWYLLGCAFEVTTPTNVDAAKYYWETALTMLAKVKEGMDMAGDEVDDEEKQCIIDQTNEIKERLDAMLDEAEEDE